MLLEDVLNTEFETLFPSENIVFISEGSLTKIVKPNLILEK